MATKIEWCDETINPIIGCTKISAGCANCYAEKMATRLKHIPTTGLRYMEATEHGKWTGKMMFVPSEFEKPYAWKSPRRIFVGSMGDIFHENVPMLWLDELMLTIKDNPHHTFMLLTKRANRMQFYLSSWLKDWSENVIDNLWIGVTVENQAMADERIPLLLNTPAAVRFVSVEPMLGQVNLGCDGPEIGWVNYLLPPTINGERMPGIDWVICGAETGPKARPMQLNWARELRDECERAGVTFFFKKDSKKCHTLDGQVWEQLPEDK